MARAFAHDVEVGMVGLNAPIPVPMALHSFGGWNAPIFDERAMHGEEGLRFKTRIKTSITRWPSGMRTDPDFVMPPMGRGARFYRLVSANAAQPDPEK